MFHEIRNQTKPPCSTLTTRGLCLALISVGFCVFSTPSRAPTPTSRGGAPSPRVIASGWLSVCWLVRATASERPETRKKVCISGDAGLSCFSEVRRRGIGRRIRNFISLSYKLLNLSEKSSSISGSPFVRTCHNRAF